MTVGLQKMEGFDTYSAITDVGQTNNTQLAWVASGNGTISFVSGAATRFGSGQCLRIDPQAATNSRYFGINFTSTASGSNQYFGFNVYIGITGTAPQNFHKICSFDNGVGGTNEAAGSASFWFQTTSGGTGRSWNLRGPGGLTGALLATGTPSLDPYQRWTFVEIRLFRDDVAGKVQLWQEKVDGTMELVIDYTGNTSTTVTGFGTISRFNLCGSRVVAASGGLLSNQFDDFYHSISGAIGVPCYVQSIFPTSDVQTGGWASSTGGALWSQIDEAPLVTGSDYIYTTSGGSSGTGAGAGTFPSKFLLGQGPLLYNPAHVYGIQATLIGTKIVTGTNASVKAVIHKGATDYEGPAATWATVAGNMANAISVLEQDPDTSAEWGAATANAASFGLTVTAGGAALTGGGELHVHSGFMNFLSSIATGAVAAGGQGGTSFFMICTG